MAEFAGIAGGRKNAPRVKFDEKLTSKDLRITNCTDCLKGIFTNHSKIWTSRGFVHTDCDDPKGLNNGH